MSESKFAVGDKVICIGTDGYMPRRFPIGSTFIVAEVVSAGDPNECLRFEGEIGGPYSSKFALVTPQPTKMDAKEYEEIMAARELMEGK